MPTLLGVGVEYVASAVSYFERMRQIEETSEHIIVLAGPDLLSARFGRVRRSARRHPAREHPGHAAGTRARARQVDEITAVLPSARPTIAGAGRASSI